MNKQLSLNFYEPEDFEDAIDDLISLINDSTKHYAKTVEHDGEGVIVVLSTQQFSQDEANKAVEEYMVV